MNIEPDRLSSESFESEGQVRVGSTGSTVSRIEFEDSPRDKWQMPDLP